MIQAEQLRSQKASEETGMQDVKFGVRVSNGLGRVDSEPAQVTANCMSYAYIATWSFGEQQPVRAT